MAYGDLQYLQDELQKEFDADTDTPSTTDDEWSVRLGYLNRGIRRWENVDGVWWQELWTSLSNSSPGSPPTTTTSGTATYAAPSDFRFPGGFVRVNGTYYPVIKQNEVGLHDSDGAEFAYFKGSIKDGYSLVLHPTPSATGQTIAYEYYKRATELSDAADKLQMANPDFCIYYALAELYQNQRDLTRSQNALATAEEALSDMQIRNDSTPPYQDSSPESLGNTQGIGFGA